jgi:septin 4
VDLKHRDIGRPRDENVKIQTFNAQLSLCDDYPLSLQEQILPIIDLMAIRFIEFSFQYIDVFFFILVIHTLKNYVIL